MAFRWSSSLVLAVFLALVTALVWNIPARAQSDVAQSSEVPLPAPTLRTVEEMQTAATSNVLPSAPEGGLTFRPGVDLAEYQAAKAEANSAAGSSKPGFPEVQGAEPLAVIGDISCLGTSQGNLVPPDTEGGVGFNQYVQVVNSRITVWDKTENPPGSACPDLTANPQLDVDLNSFFGYFNQTLFDPRVLHDDTFGRWLIFAEGFEDAGAQFQFIGVSAGEDAAAGPYNIFQFDTKSITCATCFWDYPQAGMDDGAIILTANIFNPGFVFSRWLILNKMHLYDIHDFTGCFFFGGEINLPSWAPPKVIDLNSTTYMLEGRPGNDMVLDGLTSTDRICANIVSSRAVPGTSYTVPPNAPQPGTTATLDTLDGRFQNRSLQSGPWLWQVRTEGVGSFPEPHFFRIDTRTATVFQNNLIVTSGTSFDFNPSITANGFNTAAVVYSSTMAAPGDQVDVRVAGKSDGDASFGASVRSFVSADPLLGNSGRFGDYSSIAIDPSNLGRAWFVNEVVQPGTNGWGSNFGNANLP